MNWIGKLDRHFEEILAASLLGIITCLLFLQVVFRYFINLPLDWTEELARYLFVDFVYLSASLGIKHNRHFRVELLTAIFPKLSNRYVEIFRDFIWLLFSVFMIKIGYDVAIDNWIVDQHSASLQVNMGYVYLIIPFGYTLMSVRILQNIYRTYIRKDSAGGE